MFIKKIIQKWIFEKLIQNKYINNISIFIFFSKIKYIFIYFFFMKKKYILYIFLIYKKMKYILNKNITMNQKPKFILPKSRQKYLIIERF